MSSNQDAAADIISIPIAELGVTATDQQVIDEAANLLEKDERERKIIFGWRGRNVAATLLLSFRLAIWKRYGLPLPQDIRSHIRLKEALNLPPLLPSDTLLLDALEEYSHEYSHAKNIQADAELFRQIFRLSSELNWTPDRVYTRLKLLLPPLGFKIPDLPKPMSDYQIGALEPAIITRYFETLWNLKPVTLSQILSLAKDVGYAPSKIAHKSTSVGIFSF